MTLAGLFQINPNKAGAKVEAIGIDTDQYLRTTYQKHAHEQAIQTRKAKTLLQRLPEPGEVITILMSGSFDGWDYVTAVLDLADGATIAELYVATLGFGEANAGQLLQQLDSGRIGRVWFVASCYMRDKHGDKFKRLSAMLEARGHRCRATRNHAKIIAMLLSDGRTISVDGSLNLCSCRNTEQAHVWNDRELFQFYRDYIKQQAETEGRVK